MNTIGYWVLAALCFGIIAVLMGIVIPIAQAHPILAMSIFVAVLLIFVPKKR